MIKQVLLVDDNRTFSKITKLLLEAHQYKVIQAYSGEEALEMVQNRPDIVILDRTLPDIDGLQVCRKIRENTEFRAIPIIILSAMDKSHDKVEGLYFGADDYLSKPFDNEELIARMDAILRRVNFFENSHVRKEELIDQINELIQNDKITPHYQTLFKGDTLEPFGLEVFNRAPKEHPLSNPEFLFRAALMVGKYFDLEMLGWNKAIKHWKIHRKTEKLFLNCSPYLVENTRFDSGLIHQLAGEIDNLVLEVTERSAVQDYTLFFDKLKDSRKAGLKIAVDDVGSGYASLDSIVQLRPEFVKIDIVLIRDIDSDHLKRNIVEAIVNFCKKSQVLTIAEGIETPEEMKAVKDLGIDILQGYLLSKPSQEINLACAVKL